MRNMVTFKEANTKSKKENMVTTTEKPNLKKLNLKFKVFLHCVLESWNFLLIAWILHTIDLLELETKIYKKSNKNEMELEKKIYEKSNQENKKTESENVINTQINLQ